MAAFTPLTNEDGARVAAAHGLGRCLGVTSVPAGTVNSNYFLDSERGRVFVRLYEQQEVDGVEYEWALLDHLVARGVPVPPRVRGPRAGELRVGGRPVAVFELVKGSDLCQALVTAPKLHAVGAALARASKAGEDFSIRRAGRFTLSELVKLHDKAEAAQRAELKEPLARLRALHADVSTNTPSLPQGVVHGDLFRDNVLWQGDQLAALLDWESASDGIVIYDLGVTMLAWCCGDTLDWSLARALVQGYQSERAIHEEEWNGLHWALRVGCLRFASTRLIDVYLKGTYAPGYKSYARFLKRLDAIEAETPESLRALLG